MENLFESLYWYMIEYWTDGREVLHNILLGDDEIEFYKDGKKYKITITECE